MPMLMRRFFAAMFPALMFIGAGAVADAGDLSFKAELVIKHKDIVLAAVPAKLGNGYDVKPLGLKEGLENIAKALDVIYAKSPLSVTMLETLKKNGEVVLVYNPDHEAGKVDVFALATFYPSFFKRNGEKGDADQFLAAIGPHAVKWPAEELAMIIVHELVGHGTQHLMGRLDYIRVLDLECAANLYSENFYQDLGIDKKSKDVVNFRKGLEEQWCSDFKRYMRQKTPSQMALWDVLNPDVPKLLKIFDAYVNEMRDTGVSGKAIEAAKKLSREESKKTQGNGNGKGNGQGNGHAD